jgi:hypothetical protein
MTDGQIEYLLTAEEREKAILYLPTPRVRCLGRLVFQPVQRCIGTVPC